jgi:methylenetetrahydrofolate dehydrogenase (NADP+) / methenyltetrahydrofolate cyclohydrolase
VTELLVGASVAKAMKAEVAGAANELSSHGTTPRMVIVVATADESTMAYVRSITRAAASTGIEADVEELGPDADAGTISGRLRAAAEDPGAHGILLQTPVPEGLSPAELALDIPAEKDIDGANPVSLGRLSSGLPAFAPATAVAVMELLRSHRVPLAGRSVAVVGRSTVVGKPLAQLLLAADATVTVCHSKTRDLAAVTRVAEVLVAAVGRAHLIGAPHVGEGAVVIDVGTNVNADGKLVGDVDGEAIDGLAAARSPVPGGVGPVTTAVLLRHVVEAAQNCRKMSGS